MVNIAVFASGSGSNAENIFHYLQKKNSSVRITCIICNNPFAGVVDRATKLGLPCIIIDKKKKGEDISEVLNRHNIDFIVLAGWLLLIPEKIISSYRNKIINIHPALLPAHGGKGFYGVRVHEAVIASKVFISGITIHHVNEKFDEGEIIFQAACYVSAEDTAHTLAEKIHELEYAYYPVVIEKFIQSQMTF
jgi:phosphoribosylglycinamide formyltransferase 1